MSMENKALAILDMAIKISENTPVDIAATYYGITGGVDLRIFWKGFNVDEDNYTDYYVPTRRKPISTNNIFTPNDTPADDMLGILEEIWAGRENG